MVKKNISLDNLNINLKIDDNVTETVSIDNSIPLETIENATVMFNNQKYILVKSDKPGVEFELVLNKDYQVENHLQKNKIRAINFLKKPPKIQSGVCFDKVVNILIKNYLSTLNTFVKEHSNGKAPKLKKVEFTDAVIASFFAQNNLTKESINKADIKKLDSIKRGLFDYTLNDTAFEKAMYGTLFEKTNQGLYADLEVYDTLTMFSIKVMDKKGTSTILNAIFRDFFIRNCDNMQPYMFLNLDTISNHKFTTRDCFAFSNLPYPYRDDNDYMDNTLDFVLTLKEIKDKIKEA